MLQCAALRCSVLQCAAVCCNVLLFAAICCSVVQCVAVFCNVLTLMTDSFDMGWLRLVGYLNLQVSFAKEPCKRGYILQKTPIILSSLLIVATPYAYVYMYTCTYVHVHTHMYMYIRTAHIRMYIYIIAHLIHI